MKRIERLKYRSLALRGIITSIAVFFLWVELFNIEDDDFSDIIIGYILALIVFSLGLVIKNPSEPVSPSNND